MQPEANQRGASMRMKPDILARRLRTIAREVSKGNVTLGNIVFQKIEGIGTEYEVADLTEIKGE